MRGRARKDANHVPIVEAIRAVGADVIDISNLGNGVPDLIVRTRLGIQLAEIKNPNTNYGRRGPSELQREWARDWRGGGVFVIKNVQDALRLVCGNFEQLEQIGGR